MTGEQPEWFKSQGLKGLTIILKMWVCAYLRDEDAPAKIEDPDAAKPEGWLDDEEDFTPDPNAEKPEDWWADNTPQSS